MAQRDDDLDDWMPLDIEEINYLEEENEGVFHLIRAMRGVQESTDWLHDNSLYCFRLVRMFDQEEEPFEPTETPDLRLFTELCSYFKNQEIDFLILPEHVRQFIAAAFGDDDERRWLRKHKPYLLDLLNRIGQYMEEDEEEDDWDEDDDEEDKDWDEDDDEDWDEDEIAEGEDVTPKKSGLLSLEELARKLNALKPNKDTPGVRSIIEKAANMITLQDYWSLISDHSFLYYFNANNIYFRQMFDNVQQASATVDSSGKSNPDVYSVVGSALYHLVNDLLRSETELSSNDIRLIADLQEASSSEWTPRGVVHRVIFTLKAPESGKGVNGLNPTNSNVLKTPTKSFFHIRLLCLYSEKRKEFSLDHRVHFGELKPPLTEFLKT